MRFVSSILRMFFLVLCWKPARWEGSRAPRTREELLLHGGWAIWLLCKAPSSPRPLKMNSPQQLHFFFPFLQTIKKKRLPREPKSTVIIKVSLAFSLETCFRGLYLSSKTEPLCCFSRLRVAAGAGICFDHNKKIAHCDKWAIMRGGCF